MTQQQDSAELMPWLEHAMHEFYQHGLVVISHSFPS